MRCLRSLRSVAASGVHVLFVDNGSTDGSFERAREEFPEFEYLQNGANLFFSGGNNRAMERAMAQGAEYLFILNNDTEVLPGCIDTLTAFMDATPGAAACQPLLCAMHAPERIASAGCRVGVSGKAWDHLCGQAASTAGDAPFEVLGVTGGAMFVRASVLHEVGLFDESFQMYFEDVDLSLRMRRAGSSLWCVPGARVLHMVSATANKERAWWRAYLCERNSWRVLLKNFPLPRILQGMALSVPASFLAAAVNVAHGNVRYGAFIAMATVQGMFLFLRLFPRRLAETGTSSPFWHLVDGKVVYPPPCPHA